MLDVMETVEEMVQPFKDFIMKNHSNPFLWTGFVLLGLLVFGIAYNALHRD